MLRARLCRGTEHMAGFFLAQHTRRVHVHVHAMLLCSWLLASRGEEFVHLRAPVRGYVI